MEDNLTNQQVAHDLLCNEGAVVSVANDGHEALAALPPGEPAFDLVLMDIQMPELDGYEATRRLRRDFSASVLPVIAMTAN